MRRSLAYPTSVLLLFAFTLPGCGSGGGQTSASSTAVGTAQQGAARVQAEEQGRPEAKEQTQKSTATPGEGTSNPPRQQVPVGEPEPGSKAVAPGVPIAKGGDNSIQAYGTEAEEDPREEAVANLTAYLSARLSGEWAKACSLASAQFREQLKQLIESAKAKGDAKKPQGCPETLALLTPSKAKAQLAKLFQVDEVLSFRIEGEYAYLIFKGEAGKVMFIAMKNEEGQWRVNVLQPEGFPGGAGS